MATSRPSFSLLSVASNLERHKLASSEPFLVLMDIAYPGDAAPSAQQHLRLARNNDDYTFDAGDGNGTQTYMAFNFSLGDLKVSSDSSVPEMDLVCSNVMRALQGAIVEYQGAVGAQLYLYVVNTANPAGEPDLALAFTIKQTTSDAKSVKFKLGASSPLRRNFPLHYYRPNFCIWKYKSIQCGYTGPMTTCSHTIDGPTGCIAHNNLVRIGTFPGIDSAGIDVASVA